MLKFNEKYNIDHLTGLSILITGGAGFIGKHLCRTLLDNGNKVRIIDNLSFSSKTSIDSRAEFIHGDITNKVIVKDSFKDIDLCVHLAAIASVDRCNKQWALSSEINALGTLNIFEAAILVGNQYYRKPIPVIYASSAAVYGDQGVHTPIYETANLAPSSSYGLDKLYNEMQAEVGGKLHGLPTVGLRFFNVYGSGQNRSSDYSGVITSFIHQALRGKSLYIHGDGLQSRDFIYVTDVVDAIIASMKIISCDAPIFNVSTGNAVNINSIAKVLQELIDDKIEVIHRDKRQADIYYSCGSYSHLNQYTGWNPKVKLKEGLNRTFLSLAEYT